LQGRGLAWGERLRARAISDSADLGVAPCHTSTEFLPHRYVTNTVLRYSA